MKNKKQVFNAKEQTLDNGLKIVSIVKDSPISSIHVGIQIGAMFEEMEEKGICHFIEHMLFKGTKNRDNNKINQDLEERAGSYNAYTDYTSTVLSITALYEELEASMEILADIIMNSNFPEKEIEKERKVILAEYKSHIDDVEQYSYQKVNEIAFVNSPLRYDVLGIERNIKNFTKKKLENFYHLHYIPNRCVISVISPYAHEKIKEMIEKNFGQWKKGKKIDKQIIIEDNLPIQKISYKRNIEQNTLIYLYTFYGLTRKEELALEILNHKLGVSANSILFGILREESGIAYDVYSEMDASDLIKTLYIYTAVAKEDIIEAQNKITNCINKLKRREILISQRDIILMKKVIKTGVASMLEDTPGLGNYILHQKMSGKKIDAFVEDMESLDYIQEEDIDRVIEKVFRNPTVHILMQK